MGRSDFKLFLLRPEGVIINERKKLDIGFGLWIQSNNYSFKIKATDLTS